MVDHRVMTIVSRGRRIPRGRRDPSSHSTPHGKFSLQISVEGRKIRIRRRRWESEGEGVVPPLMLYYIPKSLFLPRVGI